MHWHSIYDHTQQQSEKKLTDSSSSVGSEEFSTPFSIFPIDLKKKSTKKYKMPKKKYKMQKKYKKSTKTKDGQKKVPYF